jgi:hypothetical protein
MTPPAVSIPSDKGATSRRRACVSFQMCHQSLDSGTICDSLVGVDALVGLLAIEEVRDELDGTGNTGGTTAKDNLMNIGLIDFQVTENLLNGLEGTAEEVLAKLFKMHMSEGSVEVNTLKEQVDFNGGLGGGVGTLSMLTSCAQTMEGTGVQRQVLLVLALELLDKVVDEMVIEVLTTQVSVTGSGIDLKDTVLDGHS